MKKQIKMKTRNLLTLLVVFFYSFSLLAQDELEGYKFKDVTDIKVTNVKDQQRTGTCWSFSTTSFIEAELLRINKTEYDLSEMYFARNAYINKALGYIRYHGKFNFGEGGQAHDVVGQIKKHGFVTQEAYPGNMYDPGYFNHNELEQVLKAMLDVFITTPNRKLTPVWLDAYTSVLDTYLGIIPETIEINGKKINPVDFAKSTGFNPDDYVEITSFTHHPYYEKVILELPDNWSNDPYYNVPLNELLEIMNYSLQEGYTFVWDGDVGFEGFSHKNNVAVVHDGDYDFKNPKTEKEITVECRQKQFDNLTTTDDHLMHITALAQDQNGTIYYKTKNSWGEESNNFGGYLYMSETYMRLNTIAIMVHKNAIPKEIKEKLGIK